jgi:hypothetical protein
MVVTTPSRTADPPPAPRYLRAPVPVHFPSHETVGQTQRHLHQTMMLWELLQPFREHSAVGCNQFVYWDPTDPRQNLAPDAFVRLGGRDDMFENWKVWERGAPDVAVEILSDFDKRDQDQEGNLEKYRQLGVRELVMFDSDQDPPSLRVWNSVDGDLVERAVDGVVAPSLCLPLTWVVVPDDEWGSFLRLARDPEGKDLWLTTLERVAELQRSVEKHDSLPALQARIAELEAELRRRGG